MLIVEDQAAVRTQLRAYVQMAWPEAQIAEAGDGEAALAACASRTPNVVLMDIELPGVDGLTLTRTIRSLYPSTTVIVVSQHPASIHARLAVAAGAFAYVEKDRVAADLLPVMRRAITEAAQ